MGVPPVKIGPHPYLFLKAAPKRFCIVGFEPQTKGTVLLVCLSADAASQMPVASNFCVVGFVRWGYFFGDNNFWGWCYVIGLEFVCECARMVIFS